MINDGEYMTEKITQQPLGVASDLNAELGILKNENERLIKCLKKANEQAEEFERKFYLLEIESEILKQDSMLLSFLEDHKQYVLGFAPSGDWSAFEMRTRKTCYGKTLRECLEMLQVMHNDINA